MIESEYFLSAVNMVNTAAFGDPEKEEEEESCDSKQCEYWQPIYNEPLTAGMYGEYQYMSCTLPLGTRCPFLEEGK
jgi:hypothetical protein